MAKISQKLRSLLENTYNLPVDELVGYLKIEDRFLTGVDNLKDMRTIFAEASKYRSDTKESQLPAIACIALEHAIKNYKPDKEELIEIGKEMMQREGYLPDVSKS